LQIFVIVFGLGEKKKKISIQNKEKKKKLNIKKKRSCQHKKIKKDKK
jgi:hypothetical protein